MITARSVLPIPSALADRPNMVRVEPGRTNTTRTDSTRTPSPAAARTKDGYSSLLAVICQLASRVQGARAVVCALSGFPRGQAGLLQLVDADGTVPRQARDDPCLLRTRYVPARLLQHHLLRCGAGHGSVTTEIHQVRQHPDRLVSLSRLPFVVPVD